MITKDLGAVSAYAYAVEKGYTGTEAEYAELMASYATVAEQASQSAQTATEKAQQASASATSASQSADTASASAQTAQTAQQTATAKASEAQQSATTATTKAQEASQSASESSQSASTAVQAKQDAQTAKTASETAQASAESARDDAESARDEAQQSAESIDPQRLIGAYPVDTATGAIASFPDGADNIPMKKVTVRIEPKQAGTGDPSPENICPISGWTEVQCNVCGINLFDKATAVTGYIDDSTGELKTQGLGQSSKSTDYISVKPNASYYISSEQTRGAWGAWYDDDKNYISGIFGYIATASDAQKTKVAPSNARYMRLTVENNVNDANYGIADTFSVNYPSTDHSYHLYTGRSITIDLGQTVYGGKLDVLSGELTVDMAMVDLGTLNWEIDGTRFKASVDSMPNKAGRTIKMACSCFKALANGEPYDASADLVCYGAYSYVYVHDFAYTDIAAFKTAVTGQQLAYELATPITLTLSPTEIRSLLGDNNIWADTGDSTVIYRADTTMYINRKIAEAVSALS